MSERVERHLELGHILTGSGEELQDLPGLYRPFVVVGFLFVQLGITACELLKYCLLRRRQTFQILVYMHKKDQIHLFYIYGVMKSKVWKALKGSDLFHWAEI